MERNDKKRRIKIIYQNILWRLFISLVIIFTPAILLLKHTYGSFLFTFSIPIIWEICIKGRSFSSLGFSKSHLGFYIPVGILSGVIMGLAGGWFFRLLSIYRFSFLPHNIIQIPFLNFDINFFLSNELGYRLLRASQSRTGLFFYLIFIIFVIGLGEELFWRGFLQKKIALTSSKHFAIFLTSILFSLSHLYLFAILTHKELIFSLFMIALSGVFWGYLYEYTQNILAPAFSHGISAFIIWKFFFFAI